MGGRLGLDDVRTRAILPALNRCTYYGFQEGKKHVKQEHAYERDTRLPEWHGWHAARRGLGSNLHRLGVPDKVIQAILRHSNVNVTLGYYVKSASSDVIAAMGKFEKKLAVQSLRDTNRTLESNSGATLEFLN